MAKFRSNKVVVVGKYRNSDMGPLVQEVCDVLASCGFEAYIDEETRELNNLTYPIADFAKSDEFGLCIAIGGDGTMLGACRKWGIAGIPMLGVNKGGVGFLTDIPVSNLKEQLSEILQGGFFFESRNVLNVKLLGQDGVVLSENLAVNDFVFRPTRNTLMNYTVYAGKNTPDKLYSSNQRADGLIVATPTGSTAYALPAGGSILMPESKVFIVAPICPQRLGNRPIVLSDDYRLKICSNTEIEMKCVLDGVEFNVPEESECFIVERAKSAVTFVHHNDYSYFDILREKLQVLV